jgi:hypothetical protein
MNRSSFARAAAVTLACAAGFAACTNERTSVLQPFGAPSWDYHVVNTGRNLPRGTIQRTRPALATAAGTVTIRLNGLEVLAGTAVYRVWLADSALTTFVLARGNLKVLRSDTTLNAQGDPVVTVDSSVVQAGVSSFNLGGPRHQIRLIVDSASLGSNPLATGRVVVVTIEPDAASASPAATVAHPLGIAYTIPAAGATATTNLKFGYFHVKPESLYVYISVGRGTGGVRDNILLLDDSAMTRPPLGFFYATYMVVRDTNNAVVDTLALGAQTAPYPRRGISLYDADASVVDAVVQLTPPAILAAALRINGDTIAALSGNSTFTGPAHRFRGVSDVWVVLQSKLGDPTAAPPNAILTGALPSVVTKGP